MVFLWLGLLRAAEFGDQRFLAFERKSVDAIQNHPVGGERNSGQCEQGDGGDPKIVEVSCNPKYEAADADDEKLQGQADQGAALARLLIAERGVVHFFRGVDGKQIADGKIKRRRE
jgi:hypothetical protein